MTLQECKDKVAQNRSFESWERFASYVDYHTLNDAVDVAMTAYAEECAKASLIKAAENADIKDDLCIDGVWSYVIDQSTITNEDNIVLL